MEKSTQPLLPWFVTGLIEGEGCFSVSFTKRKKLMLGIEVKPSFSISLNRKDLHLLKKVHAFFVCGAIRFSKSDQTYKYEVRSVKDLIEKIIPHFFNYPLQGAKQQDFLLLKTICELIRVNLHRNKEHLVQIIETAYRMNSSGKRRHEKRELLRILGK